MSKSRKKQRNPDFRHRVSVAAPASEEIESRLFEIISPGTFANLIRQIYCSVLSRRFFRNQI